MICARGSAIVAPIRLYGPLKLNWVIDLGATLTVLVAAAYYVRIVRVRP
ncbi:MAG: hypothetical protein ACOVQY_03395 [Erythrobacter sp.]